jgi:hypothetical protein
MDGSSVFYYVVRKQQQLHQTNCVSWLCRHITFYKDLTFKLQYAGALILVFILLTCLLAIYGTQMERTVELQVKLLMQSKIKYDGDGSGETRLDGIQEAVTYYLYIGV